MAKGEFENREAEELGIPGLPGMGELSEELADERGELDSYSTRQLANGVPADIQAGKAATDQVARTGVGSPSIDYQVRSVYDSRPVNGRDFNLWFTPGFNTIPLADLGTLLKCWQVPRGMVAVLRGVTVIQAPQVGELEVVDGTLRIQIDGVTKEPPTVRLGPSLGSFTELAQSNIPYYSGVTIETFLIADENLFVGAAIDPVTSVPLDAGSFLLGFHGQFLQKTGVPAQFQIANKAGQAMTADTVSPQSLSSAANGGPSGKDFLVRRRRRVSAYEKIPLINTPK